MVRTVTKIPRPGATGLFVDLGQPPAGLADVLHLPTATATSTQLAPILPRTT